MLFQNILVYITIWQIHMIDLLLFEFQFLRHEEFEKGCDAACNG